MRKTAFLSRALTIAATAAFLLFFGGTAMGQSLTIMHTNDMHSNFLASPNADYSPETTGDDTTIGGIARIATKLNEVRTARALEGIPVLLLDGGDFTMGTLFHLLRGKAELGMMNFLGYDAVVVGNHEYDLLPTGVAEIVSHREDIRVLSTNVEVLDPAHPWGAPIQAAMDSGDILPWTTQTLANGIKVGYFGILGDVAWAVVNKPYGSAEYPLGQVDRFTAAAAAVHQLRNVDEVDIVICLSHSGVNEPEYWTGEDVDLADAVPGIDVIISGHTHTYIPSPVVAGNTIIVQASAYTARLGVLDLEYDSGLQKWNVVAYESVLIDDTIPGDAATIAKVQQYIDELDEQLLEPLGFGFADAIVETAFDLRRTYMQEHSLGNLVTDAIRWSVDRILDDPNDPVVAAVESNGVIRRNLLAGETGIVQTSDAFEVLPLGVDPLSEEAGYPLVTFCMYGRELFNAAWVNALAAYLQDTDFWISWSGVGFLYTDYLPPLAMWRCLDPNDPTCSSRISIHNNHKALYRVALNYYVASNIERLEDLSYGLIKVVPKDCATGAPLTSLADAIVYKAPGEPLMQYEGFFDYLASFPDTDADGIANMPDRYAGPEGRMVRACVVASVAYGSPFEEKVRVLADFRDEILMKSSAGRTFVDLYYAHGGAVAKVLAESDTLKAMTRILLLPFVGGAKLLLWLI